MVKQLRAIAALVEDLGTSPSRHMVANSPQLQFQGI